MEFIVLFDIIFDTQFDKIKRDEACSETIILIITYLCIFILIINNTNNNNNNIRESPATMASSKDKERHCNDAKLYKIKGIHLDFFFEYINTNI